MKQLPAKSFDAVYCSHNLEHYYRHDLGKVLQGFIHVLKEDGFAHVRVPNVGLVMRLFIEQRMGMDSVLYVSPAGPITIHDVIYGYGKEIADSGNDFYAHKIGFTSALLARVLREAGFSRAEVVPKDSLLELEAYACTA
jgi:SAM-dependent methyltransferase